MTINVDGDGVEGGTDIQVKGDLQGTAEYFALCGCGVGVAIGTALVCWIARIEGLSLLAVSLTTGVASLVTGIWYLSRRRSARNCPTRRRTRI